jgi:outer membrane protein TolC
MGATLTLDECLSLAKSNNPSLRLSRMDIGIASKTIEQSDASLFPRIDAQAAYTLQQDAQAMKLNGLALETQQATYLSGSVGIDYTVYDFGRRDARRKISRTNLDAVNFTLENQEHEIALQVVENYFGILEAKRNISAAEEELSTIKEHRRVAQALYDAGSVTRNDLLQADVRLANAGQQLLVRKNILQNLYLQLNFLIGQPDREHPELVEPQAPELNTAFVDSSKALQQRPDLQALRKATTIKEQEINQTRSAFYPELFTHLSVDYLENNKLREQTIYAATFGLRINLFDGFASTATREKAVAENSRAREQVRLAEEQAALEIATVKNNLKVAFDRIAVTKESIVQGEENLRINRDRYEERVGTATEVLDAQTLLTQAKTEYYRSIYDYQRAAARLRKAVGKLQGA